MHVRLVDFQMTYVTYVVNVVTKLCNIIIIIIIIIIFGPLATNGLVFNFSVAFNPRDLYYRGCKKK